MKKKKKKKKKKKRKLYILKIDKTVVPKSFDHHLPSKILIGKQ